MQNKPKFVRWLEGKTPEKWKTRFEELTVVTTDRPSNAYAQLFRYIIAATFFVWAALVHAWVRDVPYDLRYIWLVLAVGVVHTFVIMGLHSLFKGSFLRGPLFVLGFTVDTAISYAAVAVTGGIHSYFFLLCYFCIIDTALYFKSRGAMMVTTLGVVLYIMIAFKTTLGEITRLDVVNVFVLLAPCFYYFVAYGIGVIESEQAQRTLNRKLLGAYKRSVSLYEFSSLVNRTHDSQEIGTYVNRHIKSYFNPERVELVLYGDRKTIKILGDEAVEEIEPEEQKEDSLLEDVVIFQITDGDKRYGTIILMPSERITNEQYEYLSKLVNQAALALKNSTMVEKLKEKASTDYLTGLYNHRYFQEKLTDEVERARRYKTPLSLILTDIDNFKKFNDTYGHQFGDLALKEVAAAIKRAVRASDFTARYGGEEMAVILSNTDLEGACRAAERICEAVRSIVLKDESQGVTTKVTVSVGVAEYCDGKERLIKEADEALYAAKRAGKDRYVPYRPEMVCAQQAI